MKAIGHKFDLLKIFSEELMISDLNPYKELQPSEGEAKLPQWIQNNIDDIKSELKKKDNKNLLVLYARMSLVEKDIKDHIYTKKILPLLKPFIDNKVEYFKKMKRVLQEQINILNKELDEEFKIQFGDYYEEVVGYVISSNVNPLEPVQLGKNKYSQNLPIISKENVKEAYNWYSKTFIANIQSYLNNPEIFELESQYLMDYLYIKLGINYRCFTDLLNHHNLLEDSEVLQMTKLMQTFQYN